MKLRRNQYCAIHRSLFGCSREQGPKLSAVSLVFSAWQIRFTRGISGTLARQRKCGKLLDRKIVGRSRESTLCRELFTDYHDVVPDHIVPKAQQDRGDDHPVNIQARHWWCNREKGSARIDDGPPISVSSLAER